MRALKRVKALEILSGVTEGAYDVVYSYDVQQRITMETITGDIERITEYIYDSEDNITSEIVKENGKVITKTYLYDSVTKNITSVHVSIS